MHVLICYPEMVLKRCARFSKAIIPWGSFPSNNVQFPGNAPSKWKVHTWSGQGQPLHDCHQLPVQIMPYRWVLPFMAKLIGRPPDKDNFNILSMKSSISWTWSKGGIIPSNQKRRAGDQSKQKQVKETCSRSHTYFLTTPSRTEQTRTYVYIVFNTPEKYIDPNCSKS